MSYFIDNYNAFGLPLDGKKSFRPVQVAAIHAATAHFFSDQTAALVVMPTGTGKTAVLAGLCFTLRARRVLVLTPSKILRDQIGSKLSTLEELKRFGAIPALLPQPNTTILKNKMRDASDWEALRASDVVVCTPICVSGNHSVVPLPPSDLFDLVIVDEAHHAPATTWAAVLASFPEARKVLLTATPFRRDNKEIKAKIAFTYDLKRAKDDGLFGDLTFQPVHLDHDGDDADVAVAKATEEKFVSDKAAGYDHLVLVRTDSVPRGEQLVKVYEKNTKLRLQLVTGSTSAKRVTVALDMLAARKLDGLIAVNMFGEGFDLPNLKIAAVHSPHKSLAVTLQFIGRFARTSGENVGMATFLAEPQSAKKELSELYTPGARWGDVVANLASSRVVQEANMRARLDTFEQSESAALDDVSLWSIRPYFHVKVLRVGQIRDLEPRIELPGGRKIVDYRYSAPENSVVIVSQLIKRARWTSDTRLADVHYDLFVVHHSPAQRLLFICSTCKSPEIYAELARKWALAEIPRPLSAAVVNHALNDIGGLEFFSVGMRRRSLRGATETYRTMSGPSADRDVKETDGRLYDRGHVFGKGITNRGAETIGVSTRSKVWSNRTGQIPELLEWCSELGEKINSSSAQPTGSGIDRLSVGQPLSQIPPSIVGASWNGDEYRSPRFVSATEDDAPDGSPDIVDFSINVTSKTDDQIQFSVSGAGWTWNGVFLLRTGNLVEFVSGDRLWVHGMHGGVSLEDYLSDRPPTFFTGTMDRIDGLTIYAAPNHGVSFDNDDVQAVDWVAAGVNIASEKIDGPKGISIFSWLEAKLLASPAQFVFCDDNAGEVADFIALDVSADPVITLYHCKGSLKKPGKRVTDLYEVCCQAIRSSMWVGSDRLHNRLAGRLKRRASKGVVKGTMQILEAAFSPASRQRVRIHVVVVQPGLQVSRIDEKISEVLVATKSYVVNSGFEGLQIIGSP